MRHDGGMVDQAFHAAERFGQGEQFGLLAETLGRVEAALEHDRDDAAEAGHLALGQCVLRVRGQAGVDHLLDRGVGFQPLRQRQRVLAMRAHAQRQGLEAAQREEAVERALHAADGVLQEGQLLSQLGVVADHRDAADHVRVAVEVLGGRVHDDVGAQAERALQHRRGKGVVDHDQQAVLARDRGDGGDIDQLEHRVGRGFDPHHLGAGTDRGFEGGRIGQVDEAEIQAGGAATHALEQAEGAAIQVVHRHHVAAGVQQLHHRGGGGHAGGERERTRAAFQRRDTALIRKARGVVGARILEALMLARAGLRIGGRRVDRRHHRPGAGVRRLPSMDRQRGEREFALAIVAGCGAIGHGGSRKKWRIVASRSEWPVPRVPSGRAASCDHCTRRRR